MRFRIRWPMATSWRGCSALLYQAADLLEAADPELSGYLRHRARDLLADELRGGDVAWLTGNFRKPNVQIGAYETATSDELFGAKASFGFSS